MNRNMLLTASLLNKANQTNEYAKHSRPLRRPVHGVLLLDKPLSWSSNDALQKVKRLFRAEKAGHTGTLDPLATGLLPLCFGAATKFSQVALDADKRYLATLKLGQTTSTGDAEGEIKSTCAVPPLTIMQIEQACMACTGNIDQMPPMYSALKHDGRALYEYAREGLEIERKTRRITVHQIKILNWHADLLDIEVHCSKGTYIRTLAESIGHALECGAHLVALRRTGSDSLTLDKAVSLEALANMTEFERDQHLMPVDCLVAEWPQVMLDADETGRFLTGLRRQVALPDMPKVRVYGPNPNAADDKGLSPAKAPKVFIGGAHITAGELIPDRLLSPVEVQAIAVSNY